MDLHDTQLDHCLVKELEQALFIVEEEIRLRKARAIVKTKTAQSQLPAV
jgi:hypothetical protein